MKGKESQAINRLYSIGIHCFVKYYEIFQANNIKTSNSEIMDAFSKNNESWTENSYKTRASNGKAIFRDKQELEVLDFIIHSEENGKISIADIEKAKKLRFNLIYSFRNN